ncbi:MAG: type II toxin-antitoxin system RelB/DinJ family antitoxin [Erysipelotrichaceae bacterium]
MSNTLIQFRTDEVEKTEAIQILNILGLDMPSYLRMCISRLVRDKGIPFSMQVDEKPANKGVEAMKMASKIAEVHGISEMPLDEINMEISSVRGKQD